MRIIVNGEELSFDTTNKLVHQEAVLYSAKSLGIQSKVHWVKIREWQLFGRKLMIDELKRIGYLFNIKIEFYE